MKKVIYPFYEESASEGLGLHREKGGGKGRFCELCYER